MRSAQHHEFIGVTCGLVSRFFTAMACQGTRGRALDESDLGAYCLDAPEWSPAGSTVPVEAGYLTSSLSLRGQE